MPKYVVDSNVAVKWSATEDRWQQARALLEGDDQDLIAPISLLNETLNALVHKYRSREITETAVRGAVPTLSSSIRLYAIGPLVEPALELSLRYTISMHDALYLALALREDCGLVTDDRRFMNAVARHFPDTLRPLESMPGW